MGKELKNLDVEGLSDKDIRMVKDFISILRAKSKIESIQRKQPDKIIFATKESCVIGPLTREHIYYL